MVQFDSNDLFFDDYQNTITNSYFPDYLAIEDFENVNLRERFEIIFFCDHYISRSRIDKEICNFQKVERIVRSYPRASVSRKELMRFVSESWSSWHALSEQMA